MAGVELHAPRWHDKHISHRVVRIEVEDTQYTLSPRQVSIVRANVPHMHRPRLDDRVVGLAWLEDSTTYYLVSFPGS